MTDNALHVGPSPQLAPSSPISAAGKHLNARERAECLVEPMKRLLTSLDGAFCFPVGSILPTEPGSRSVQLDMGIDTLPKRAFVFMRKLDMLPETQTRETGGGGTRPEALRTGPLASQLRQNFADWLTWQDTSRNEVLALQAADAKLLPVALLLALSELSETDDQTREASLLFNAKHERAELANARLESIIDKIGLNVRNDTYNRSILKGGEKVGRTVKVHAARKDATAHRLPTYGSYLALMRQANLPADLKAVGDTLALPFGGRTLLAALYIKLVLNHLCLFVSNIGARSPAAAVVQDRALRVLNTAAAKDNCPLAPTAAKVAGALRLQRLGQEDGSAHGDVLSSLPTSIRDALPACFRREQLHFPGATQLRARAVFKQFPQGPTRREVDLVTELAQLTASLLLDMLSSNALGLKALEFNQLAQRIEHLKKGGTEAKLQSAAPDSRYRTTVLLPQMDRAYEFHSWMARAGAQTLANVRARLQQEAGWPAVPELVSVRAAIRAEHRALTR